MRLGAVMTYGFDVREGIVLVTLKGEVVARIPLPIYQAIKAEGIAETVKHVSGVLDRMEGK